MFDGNDLFGILIPWNFGARVWVSTFCTTLSCARHQKHPETSRNTESWKCFWTPQRTPKQSSFLKQLAEGQKKNIHKSQWFSGFRPHLHRHQLVDTGIMMYNGAPISPRWCWICLGLMPSIISPIKNSWLLHDFTRMFECYPMNNTIFNRAHHESLILLLVILISYRVDL